MAVLLLAAALLKITGLAIDSTGSARDQLIGPEILVGLELLLAAWLWSGIYPLLAWLTTCITFAGFAAASFYLGWIGQASCGCLGAALSINPWFTFAFDILLLALLLASRPTAISPTPLVGTAAPVAIGLAGVAALWVVLAGLAFALYGSPEAALAAIRGERLSILPSAVDVGSGIPGEFLAGTMELANRTDKPIRVIGGTSDCSCIATDDLPLTVAPRQTHTINVKMRLPAAPGLFSRKAMLLTDDEQTRRVSFRLTGRIIETSASHGK